MLANDSGRIDSVLNYALKGHPDGLRFSSDQSNTIEWIPSEDQGPGVYEFEVLVSDGKHVSVRKIVINVKEVNASPVALHSEVETKEDLQVMIELKGFDAEGSVLTYEVVDSPQWGELVGAGSMKTYVPDKDFNGEDAFTFKVSDGELQSGLAKVKIKVLPLQDLPQISFVSPLVGALRISCLRLATLNNKRHLMRMMLTGMKLFLCLISQLLENFEIPKVE